jgi:hypothetical protein
MRGCSPLGSANTTENSTLALEVWLDGPLAAVVPESAVGGASLT